MSNARPTVGVNLYVILFDKAHGENFIYILKSQLFINILDATHEKHETLGSNKLQAPNKEGLKYLFKLSVMKNQQVNAIALH